MGGILPKSTKEPHINQRKGSVHSPPPLVNNDEMCYMNAIMQALGSCTKMRDDLRKLEFVYHSIKLKQFINLLLALDTSSAQVEFDSFISLYGWCMKGQQDSYEVLSMIINSIYKEMRENSDRQADNDIRTVFPGIITMCSRTTCGCESRNQNSFQDHALHLPLFNTKGIRYKIEDMIDDVYKNSAVDEKCNKCHKSQSLSVAIEGKLPRTLCLHIQANKYDPKSGSIIKPKYTLKFPHMLETHGLMYQLVSFLDHSGGVSVGHYVAYRRFHEEWFCVNDNIIEPLDRVDDPMKYCSKPYILFYELFCET